MPNEDLRNQLRALPRTSNLDFRYPIDAYEDDLVELIDSHVQEVMSDTAHDAVEPREIDILAQIEFYAAAYGNFFIECGTRHDKDLPSYKKMIAAKKKLHTMLKSRDQFIKEQTEREAHRIGMEAIGEDKSTAIASRGKEIDEKARSTPFMQRRIIGNEIRAEQRQHLSKLTGIE